MKRPLPAVAPVRGVLQRKCACGTHKPGGGTCEACADEERVLQRKLSIGSANDPLEHEADRVADQVLSMSAPPAPTRGPLRIQRLTARPSDRAMAVPASVERVLGGAGRPLDGSVRENMEARFGHDFSQVRVHEGAAAARSARDVGARAYTVGQQIVFGGGRPAFGTPGGDRLLAHELTHVVQQTGGMGASAAPEALQRNGDPIEVDLVPIDDEGRKEAERLGINLPRVSEGTWRLIGGVADNAGKALVDAEKQNIEAILAAGKVPAGTPLATPVGGRFLLHDTSSNVGAKSIQQQKADGRGPRGSGVGAYVPASGDAVITRPNFFEARRPSTSEFEKNIEAFKEPGDAKKSMGEQVKLWKSRRDALFRKVWNATSTAKQDEAFDRAMAGTGLTADEITEEKSGNTKTGAAANPGVTAALGSGSTKNVTTSSSWAVEEICGKVNDATVAGIAVPGQEADLKSACAALSAYFVERNLRISGTVPVEIVQPGVVDPKGNQNSCDPNNPNIAPLSDPPYSADQYKNIALLYLRAAHVAGTFPEITTHFVVDGFIAGHCDPRCFNLGHLYDLIAQHLGHGIGSTYGITPSYGLKWKTNTIWWDDTICHGAHP